MIIILLLHKCCLVLYLFIDLSYTYMIVRLPVPIKVASFAGDETTLSF